MEPDNPVLDQYILAQTGKSDPRICFIPTASGDSTTYITNFYKAFTGLPCRPSHLSLFDPPTGDLEDYLHENDIVYVGGGSTKNMLALWNEWNLSEIFKNIYLDGTILAGISAGAICWFEQGVTDSIPGKLSAIDCLGFLPGSCCPHFDGDMRRRPAYQKLIKCGEIKPGYGIEDGAGLHFVNRELFATISSRDAATAYFLKLKAEEIIEIRMDNVKRLTKTDQ